MWKKLTLALFALVVLFGMTACEIKKVPAGHKGVKVYLLGSDKGVDSEEVGVGRYYLTINEDLYLFPTFTQNYVWTQDEDEGSPNDESLTFQTVEGLTVGADVGISYRINPEKVSVVFQKYRRGVEEITDTFLRNMVRDALVDFASTRPIESVYGEGKTALMDEVEASVRTQVQDIGIEIEKIYWIGSLRLPPTVTTALNAKIEATQKAQQRENEIAQAKAEAQKEIEAARGKAQARLEVASAEAKAIEVKGAALRKNPEVLTLSAIEQWDGVLPKVNSGVVPFIDVDKLTDKD